MQDINSTFSNFYSAKEILIFCTSIQTREDIDRISGTINTFPGILDWHVDLEDWEKVLRIECIGANPKEIMETLRNEGIYSREMPA